MRAVIVGADSLIGQALAAELDRRGDEVVGTTRRPHSPGPGRRVPLDLADAAAVDAFRPDGDVTILCAAMARFAECRNRPTRAHTVNIDAPTRIAGHVRRAGGRVLLLSTAAVLGCDRPHMPADGPRVGTSPYGRMRAEVEERILSLDPAFGVLRLSKVLGPNLPLFLNWIAALKAGQAVRAFTDQTFSPLAIDDVVTATLAAVEDGGGGMYQASGAWDITYHTAACHLARRLGRPESRVEPCLATDTGVHPDDITPFTSLDCSRLTGLIGWQPPRPDAVLDGAFFAEPPTG